MKWKLEKTVRDRMMLDNKRYNIDYLNISKNLSAYDMNILIHAIYLEVTKINMLVDANYFYIFVPDENNYIKCWYHKSKGSIVFEIWKTKSLAELGIVRIGILHYLL